METSENVEKYISGSKLNIDNFMRKNEYRKAFGLFIIIYFYSSINSIPESSVI